MTPRDLDQAIVVGSGPNGLAAAITMARAGCSVLLLEANLEIGGGLRSAELTLPGYIHDRCSSIYPFAAASPFFREISVHLEGLDWIRPELPLAHPLDQGGAVLLHPSIDATARGLGQDRAAYDRTMKPLLDRWEDLTAEFLRPLLHLPRNPLLLGRFGFQAMRSARGFVRGEFRHEPAQALFAGLAAHSFLPLEQPPSAAFGLVLALMGHAVHWPMPKGGAQQIANALATFLRSLGGKIQTNHPVEDLDQLPRCRAILLDVSPRQFLRMAKGRLPPRYALALERFRYGPGVFKVDYALAAPIPWRAPQCALAGTVHVGGTFAEIAQAERDTTNDRHPERPFVLVAQHSLFDTTRAPSGRHTAWAYCHVPNGSAMDMTERIEAQIERFAPGFHERILARHITSPAQFEANNRNLIGGDINGGLASLRQLVARPVMSVSPYRTPIKGTYLCSASTPPGGGVHGMSGYHAARMALANEFGHGR